MKRDVDPDGAGAPPADRSRLGFNLALTGFLLVAGYFLLTEHRAHAAQYLPLALLLLCPVLHLLHGHKRNGSVRRSSASTGHDHG